jgi:hypothetical protein
LLGRAGSVGDGRRGDLVRLDGLGRAGNVSGHRRQQGADSNLHRLDGGVDSPLSALEGKGQPLEGGIDGRGRDGVHLCRCRIDDVHQHGFRGLKVGNRVLGLHGQDSFVRLCNRFCS